MAEIWDLVNSDGKKNGMKLDREERGKIPGGCYLPCAEVWIKVGESLLLTLRHPNKSEGLKLECPGGGVLSGEDFACGAIRELYEETGILASEGDLIYLGAECHGDVYAVSYLLKLDRMPRLVLGEGEVVGHRLVFAADLEEIKEELTVGTFRRYSLYKDKICNI